MILIYLGTVAMANTDTTTAALFELPFPCKSIRLQHCIFADAIVSNISDIELDDIPVQTGRGLSAIPAVFIENGRDTAVPVNMRIGGAEFEEVAFNLQHTDPGVGGSSAQIWAYVEPADRNKSGEKVKLFTAQG